MQTISHGMPACAAWLASRRTVSHISRLYMGMQMEITSLLLLDCLRVLGLNGFRVKWILGFDWASTQALKQSNIQAIIQISTFNPS
jgi:hypothetical protein